MFKSEMDDKFAELNRRVKLTSKARYNASRRLKLQNQLSQWTLALLSVALIFISLLSASKITLSFDSSYVDIMQIIFAVLILAYSLLLATGDFSARAVKIHRCGMELGRLARKIRPFENKKDEENKYEGFISDYYNCLEKYENHARVDYLVAEKESRDWYQGEKYKDVSELKKYLMLFHDFLEKLWLSFKIIIGQFIPISHYLISIFGVYYWLYLMVA